MNNKHQASITLIQEVLKELKGWFPHLPEANHYYWMEDSLRDIQKSLRKVQANLEQEKS